MDVEGLDLLPVRAGADWIFDGYQEVERRTHRFSRVALKRGHQAVVLQIGRACPYLVGSGCPARSGGARGCDGSASSRARMCPRVVAMTSGSSMQAMTRRVPPHFGQVAISMANTRFRRCIHVMGAGDGSGFACSGSRLGTIRCRCLQCARAQGRGPGTRPVRGAGRRACRWCAAVGRVRRGSGVACGGEQEA